MANTKKAKTRKDLLEVIEQVKKKHPEENVKILEKPGEIRIIFSKKDQAKSSS